MELANQERLIALYKELDALTNMGPSFDDCTPEENQIYVNMENLKDSLFDAGICE